LLKRPHEKMVAASVRRSVLEVWAYVDFGPSNGRYVTPLYLAPRKVQSRLDVDEDG
jgi:hypothetical protein